MGIDIQYVWLAGVLGFLAIWFFVFLSSKKEEKKEIFILSLKTAVFIFLASFFIRRYWDPPTPFFIVHKIGFSIENIIFGFSLGGVFFAAYKGIFNIWKKTVVMRIFIGGIMSAVICFAFFTSFNWAFRGYLEKAWNFQAMSGTQVLGIPLQGLIFFFILGVIWSGFYELFSLSIMNPVKRDSQRR